MKPVKKSSATSLAWLSLTALLLGCEECPREGCDALSSHATEGVIAGVVASESDVVSNDCQECRFAEARVRAWPVAEAVTTDSALRAAVMGTPSGEARAAGDGKYRLDDIASGPLLVCVSSSCFNVEARDGLTTTLNVKLVNGISSGFVGASDRALERSDALSLPPGVVTE